jgi:NAD(P)-dependent dehydrogenase (short-subunit alcohol dehydrogenase family)
MPYEKAPEKDPQALLGVSYKKQVTTSLEGQLILDEKKFEDKTVVVTGAASGIGLALCRRFGRAGARLGMLDMDGSGLRTAAEGLGRNGMDCLPLQCDVSCQGDCSEAMEQITGRYGGIDVLINNAGITQRGPFRETRISVFEKVMAVNFFGSLYCTKAAIESLVERRGLIIVNESVAGVAPLLGRTGYSASKHALHGLFTSLRAELRGTGVHVMIVCPGFIRTNLQTRALGCDGTVSRHPQSRVGKQSSPDDAARAIFRGALKQRRMLVLTPVGKMSYWVSRLAPALYDTLMARKLRSELAGIPAGRP